MTRVATRDAETRFSELIARAERGEEIILTRDGNAVARLVPAAAEAVDRARILDDLLALREEARGRGFKASVDEVKSWIDEDRR